MKYDRAYFRMVGLALLPAVGVSVLIVLAGQALNMSEPAVDRVSQVLFFAAFFAACHHFRPRSSDSHSSGSRIGVD